MGGADERSIANDHAAVVFKGRIVIGCNGRIAIEGCCGGLQVDGIRTCQVCSTIHGQRAACKGRIGCADGSGAGQGYRTVRGIEICIGLYGIGATRGEGAAAHCDIGGFDLSGAAHNDRAVRYWQIIVNLKPITWGGTIHYDSTSILNGDVGSDYRRGAVQIKAACVDGQGIIDGQFGRAAECSTG